MTEHSQSFRIPNQAFSEFQLLLLLLAIWVPGSISAMLQIKDMLTADLWFTYYYSPYEFQHSKPGIPRVALVLILQTKNMVTADP